MARGNKTPKNKADDKAPEEEVILDQGPVDDEAPVEEVDLDQALAEIPETHGTGFQAYMRDKIKNA